MTFFRFQQIHIFFLQTKRFCERKIRMPNWCQKSCCFRNSTLKQNSQISSIKVVAPLALEYIYFTLKNNQVSSPNFETAVVIQTAKKGVLDAQLRLFSTLQDLNGSNYESHCAYWNTTQLVTSFSLSCQTLKKKTEKRCVWGDVFQESMTTCSFLILSRQTDDIWAVSWSASTPKDCRRNLHRVPRC